MWIFVNSGLIAHFIKNPLLFLNHNITFWHWLVPSNHIFQVWFLKYRLCQFWHHSAQQPIISDSSELLSFENLEKLRVIFRTNCGTTSSRVLNWKCKSWEKAPTAPNALVLINYCAIFKFHICNIELKLIAIGNPLCETMSFFGQTA